MISHEIINSFDSAAIAYTAEGVAARFRRQNGRQSFLRFMRSVADRLDRLGKAGTCRNYRATLNSFSRFMANQDVAFAEITVYLIEEYEAWLASNGVRPNSISFYMRILRAVYMRAVEQGLTVDRRPFSKAYTKIEKTAKRAITLEEMQRLKNLDLSLYPNLEFPRDAFLFLFYCRGMSFIDAAFLRKSDIVGGEIVYRRHKTNQQLVIGINRHIRSILNRYGAADSSFLLPILTEECADHRTRYQSSLRRINNALKKIGSMAGITTNLTTYVSRHAWASIARSKGVPTSVISDALGHDSEQTTQIYLASISNDTINRANDLILDDL